MTHFRRVTTSGQGEIPNVIRGNTTTHQASFIKALVIPSMIILILLISCSSNSQETKTQSPEQQSGGGCGLSIDTENTDCYIDKTGLRHCNVVEGF